jgi:hypothetical protein
MTRAETLLFDIRDYRGRRVIFTKKKWEEKRVDHEELNLHEFKNAMIAAIREPEEVWPDFSAPSKKYCYYGWYSIGIYVKVIIYIQGDEPYRVVSAYAIDKIKEKKYKALVRIV